MVLVAVQLSVIGSYLPPVAGGVGVGAGVPVGVGLGVGLGLGCGDGVGVGGWTNSAPDDHFGTRPDCCVILFGLQVRQRCWWRSNCPCWRLYLPPVFKTVAPLPCSAPDDHLTAGPHCRVIVRPAGAPVVLSDGPTIRAGIISPASVQIGPLVP